VILLPLSVDQSARFRLVSSEWVVTAKYQIDPVQIGGQQQPEGLVFWERSFYWIPSAFNLN
jgi:hypothetical protein